MTPLLCCLLAFSYCTDPCIVLFHDLSHHQSACPGPYWSLMFECSENKEFKPVDLATIVEQTIQGAINTKLIESTDEIVSIYYRR